MPLCTVAAIHPYPGGVKHIAACTGTHNTSSHAHASAHDWKFPRPLNRHRSIATRHLSLLFSRSETRQSNSSFLMRNSRRAARATWKRCSASASSNCDMLSRGPSVGSGAVGCARRVTTSIYWLAGSLRSDLARLLNKDPEDIGRIRKVLPSPVLPGGRHPVHHGSDNSAFESLARSTTSVQETKMCARMWHASL